MEGNEDYVVTIPCIAVVAEDFEGQDEEELTLFEGDECIVTQIDDDGWWTVQTKERVGIFPGSYLDIIDSINLPAHAKVVKTIPKINFVNGTVVSVEDITDQGWLIFHNNIEAIVPYEYLELTNEPLTPVRQESPKPPVPMKRSPPKSMPLPTPPIKQQNNPIFHKPILQKPKPHQQNNKPNNHNNNNNNNNKQKSNTDLLKKGNLRQTVLAGDLFNGQENLIAAYGDLERIQNQEYNPYLMPNERNGPKYEQEGRFEFRSYEDLPPPPPFENIEKAYVSGRRASMIDWDAKKRSAVFDDI
eukprot:TRINITY_DN310_c2_g3_i1.p1 TRINITY_DN310_c2_g3~~TRINITY_DN310_c2_g3_i1.p1  ORF type:complete len:301 (+),score=112.94 TRINITY_DN310_c2_g3_i1:71-973(+)